MEGTSWFLWFNSTKITQPLKHGSVFIFVLLCPLTRSPPTLPPPPSFPPSLCLSAAHIHSLGASLPCYCSNLHQVQSELSLCCCMFDQCVINDHFQLQIQLHTCNHHSSVTNESECIFCQIMQNIPALSIHIHMKYIWIVCVMYLSKFTIQCLCDILKIRNMATYFKHVTPAVQHVKASPCSCWCSSATCWPRSDPAL